MSKTVFALLLGGALGILDGLSALLSAPEVAPQIAGIVTGSTIKGIITGLLIGLFARKVKSLPAGIFFGLAVGAGPCVGRRRDAEPRRQALLLGDHAAGRAPRHDRRLRRAEIPGDAGAGAGVTSYTTGAGDIMPVPFPLLAISSSRSAMCRCCAGIRRRSTSSRALPSSFSSASR
jgi:hypothetical protein